MKIILKNLVIIIFIFFLFSFPEKIIADTSITFPVDKAGIAAYIKIDNYGPESLAEILYFRKEIIEQKETHVIVSFEIDIKIEANTTDNHIEEKTYPLVYLNTDGWMVAYYPKEDPASSIIQWTNYIPGNLTTTVLEDALKKMAENISTTYSTPIRYYHFAYPEANRITLAIKTIFHPNKNEDGFSVIVPGIIHEVSYFLYHSFYKSTYTNECYVKLFVDDNNVDSFSHQYCIGKATVRSRFEPNLFLGNVPHLVSLFASGREDVSFQGGVAVVFVYQAN